MITARPFLMFQDGNAQAALDLYFATFPDCRMVHVDRYTGDGPGVAGSIKVWRYEQSRTRSDLTNL